LGLCQQADHETLEVGRNEKLRMPLSRLSEVLDHCRLRDWEGNVEKGEVNRISAGRMGVLVGGLVCPYPFPSVVCPAACRPHRLFRSSLSGCNLNRVQST